MNAFTALFAADLRSCVRSRLVWTLAGIGTAWAILVVVLANSETGLAQRDALQADGASLFLLGGLGAALALGAWAFPPDAHSGYFGLVSAAGASRPSIALARVLSRLVALIAIIAVWWAVLELGSALIGLGYDAPLGVHAAAMMLNTSLALAAAAMLSSLIGAVASGVFGFIVFVSAQAVVNLKAALDQGAIAQSSSGLVTPFYVALPRGIVSPMLEDHQRRGISSLAAPNLDVNGLDVVVPASHVLNVVWTCAWLAVLVYLCAVGLKRRQF